MRRLGLFHRLGPVAGRRSEQLREADGFVAGGAPGGIEDAEHVALKVDESLWDLVHGSRSLTVSTIAGSCLVGTGFLYPEHIGAGRVLGGIGGWLALAGFSYCLERRGYGKGVALLPPDRFGDARVGLVFTAVVLCCFAVEGVEEIAWSMAFAALLLGGWSDGAWAALVAERRGLGFFGALRQQSARSKEAQKWLFRSLFGEGRR